MSFFVSHDDVIGRQAALSGPLQALAQSLSSDLGVAIAAGIDVPNQKALLSREGGRCPTDGVLLVFDPYARHSHRCPVCGQSFQGEVHDRFWIYWYQLWLAERAVHAATLGTLANNAQAERFAVDILDAYATHYPKYPNVDNTLGPTRPFFSTYIESIWLLQLCIAADLIETHGSSPVIDRFRDVVVEPSLALIESFDEGLSNRQVWNNAVLIAANRLLRRDAAAESVIWAESGLVAHLSGALLADGTWYEGENYHFFAHRGLWYCMQLAFRMDVDLPADLVARYDAGFRAPFLTALPDLTFPSRRDSQYAVSLRQWRFAEMCELGLARHDDKVLRGMLGRLYAQDISRRDTGRWKSTAEAERNLPASCLTRSDLGWKSLVFARPTIELAEPLPLPSVLLDVQGIGVLRRDQGRVYVALDYGNSGGGHGHPDRLNLLISDGEHRILDDMGTGSYVEQSLHWYRSSLAHNAPLIDGRSQQRVDGILDAWEERGAAGWISAHFDPSFGRRIARTIVAMPDYVIDELMWGAPHARMIDLPLHIDAEVVAGDATWADAWLSGGEGREDGFRFLTNTQRLSTPGDRTDIHLRAQVGDRTVDVWIGGHAPFEVWRATAPGAPGRPPARFIVLRSHDPVGRFRSVWSWAGAVTRASLTPQVAVTLANERHVHGPAEHGWHIDIESGSAKSSIDLEGLRTPEDEGVSYEDVVTVDAGPLPDDFPGFMLGRDAYRRSEQSWEEAGEPEAVVKIVRRGDRFSLDITVSRVERTFVLASETNRLDNEPADIHGAGIQLYLARGGTTAGYMIVPEHDGNSIRIRPIDGWGASIPISGSWSPTSDGYHVQIDVEESLAGGPGLGIDVVINEKPAGRERRRGQLVMTGARGEFVYLRGDRHDLGRLITFDLE
jgi:hypothetical protein